MTNEQKINALRHKVIYYKALKTAATALGSDYTAQGAEIQVKIDALETQIEALQD